jgi:NAD+ synthase (glutamine-hydrolysing)
MFTKIGGAALNQTPIDWDNNIKNIVEAICAAKEDQVEILCLPELCITGYGCEDLFLSHWVPQKALDSLAYILPYTQNIAIAVGLPVRYDGLLYNCTCFMHNQQILGFNAKQHLANDGIHYEYRWFSPWPSGKKTSIVWNGNNYNFGDLTYELLGIKIGFEICEDAWKPHEVRPAKKLSERGVDLIMNPSASHFSFGKSEIRYNLIIGSSNQYNCTYLYANLLGNEAGRAIYDGEVLIAHQGKLIQRNQRFSFENINITAAEIDFQTKIVKQEPLVTDTRDKNFEFWEATSLGLFDYLRKSGSKAFVLSLSGGADSSACAIMVAEMVNKALIELGVERFLTKCKLQASISFDEIKNLRFAEQSKYILSKILYCAYQSTANSGDATYQSAYQLASSIGATFYSWDVEKQVILNTKCIEEAIGRKLTWQIDDIALQNIQARTRSPLIWLLTNVSNALLITTSNRSEGDVGYATMDGDTSGSIAPIAGVDKDFIRKWLLWAEKERYHAGLRYVNSLEPSAELRPQENSQTDEADLMPYHWLLKIELEAIRNRKSPVEVFEILKTDSEINQELLKKYIDRFFKLWARNQWKRERLAPSFHLDDFNVDPKTWCRFPILSGAFTEELKILKDM